MACSLAIDKEEVRLRFERAASSYDRHSRVQRLMADRLIETIEGEPGSILELGCGTGYLTRLLHERFPEAAIEAVDFAPAMVARAARRVPCARFITCDIERFFPRSGGYDLIVSNATAQWLSEPGATFTRLARALREQGQMRLTTFGQCTFWELDQVLAELGHERGLDLPSAERWETLLAGTGLRRIRVHTCEERFSYPDCASFLRSVKSSGAGYAPRTLTPSVLREAIRRYDERFSSGSGVTATYEIVTLSGRR